jgi:glycosyltransferase involved in cell wall biosynthesis
VDRPHILYLIDGLWSLGGAENALLRAVRLLPRDRFRCSIGTFRLRATLPALQDLPCPVHEFPLTSVFGWQAFQSARKLRRFIRTERVDIVHTFFQTADLWGGAIAKLSGCPILISSRRDMGILRSRSHRAAYRMLGPMFDQVHAVSEAVRQYTLREEGLAADKVVTIPNGIECGTDAERTRVGFTSTRPVILTVSHLRRIKGIDVLIRAMDRVRRSYPEAMLLIAGAVNEPAYLEELNALVETLGLSANVRFLGKANNVQELLEQCDVFCLLSRSEGMSNALLEAMAAGIPCVATAVGGTPEVIEDGRTGYLVPSEDAGAAAERILRLLDHPEEARQIGDAARLVVRQRFSAQRMVDDLVRSYEGLALT